LQLQHRPAVHQLLHGAFIQEPLHLRSNVTAYPLIPIGFAAEAQYAARYAHEVMGATVDASAVDKLQKEGEHARPVVALAVRLMIDAPPEQLEQNAAAELANARMVLGWVAGEHPEPFAVVTATRKEVHFRILAPHTRRRQRLGFGNTGPDYYSQLYRIVSLTESDERFAFALSLFRDALREDNPEFRVARFFSCLEALAYRIKKGLGSRAAVRKLLGLDAGALSSFQINGVDCRYDRVELAGRIRDKLFHGVPFDPAELTPDARKAYQYLKEHPELMRDELHMDCELEVARWANNASNGQK
jgi:hypothetical protein